MAWFYEIRSSDNAVLKRDGGFADADEAKVAARAEAEKMKTSRRTGGPTVGRIMVGHKAESPTR
jgi:hypothetical protein